LWQIFYPLIDGVQTADSIITLNNCGHHYPNVVFRKVTLSIKSHALVWRVTVNHNTLNVNAWK